MIISTIYGISLLFAILIYFTYAIFYKKREKLFLLLFGSIATVNLGYFMVALSKSVSFALFANTLAYFGSAFLPMLMLLILLESLERKATRRTVAVLTALALGVFLLTATQLFPSVDLYYKEARLLFTEDGAAYLDKDYGPCHVVYTVYLMGYFAAMIYFAVSAILRKEMVSGKQTAALLVAVFVNLCVWMAEQFTTLELEFLAISYLISEIFLLLFRQLALENQRLKEILAAEEEKKRKLAEQANETEILQTFLANLESLTPTEKVVLGHYADGKSTAETMELMFISQNTLKYHNKNLYSKLFVSSRKELMETYKKAMKLKDE